MGEVVKNKEDLCIWYDNHHTLYKAYAECVKTLLENLLKQNKLPYHSITCRVKDRDSFLAKFERKGYSQIEEITDVAGVRIIAHTTSDEFAISELIKREFKYDNAQSGDKADGLKDDQVGYLSIHFIAELNATRSRLGEYSAYKGLKCEIQVRTLLQHAWAEIEHDRNYKFGGVLPKDIRRRFYLVAGALELMDAEFERLSKEIDTYGQQVAKDTQAGNLNIPIDSTSLTEYMQMRFPTLSPGNWDAKTERMIIGELADIGITTLSQLDSIISPQIATSITNRHSNRDSSYIGTLRDVMILHNVDDYFLTAHKDHWNAVPRSQIEFWVQNGVNINPYYDRFKLILETD